MKVKDKLLQTAVRLFHKQGYRTTGINQIIEEAGIAKGSFYYNFKSKDELCIAFLNQRHDYWFEALKQHISTHSGNDHDVLLAFDFLHAMNIKEDFRGCSFLNILSEIDASQQKILDVIQNHKADLRRFISTLITPEKSDHVYLLFEGALIESQLFKDQWPVIHAKNIVSTIITKS